MAKRITVSLIGAALMHCPAQADSVAAITGNPKVDALLGQMTLPEKLRLIHDSQEDPATYQGQAGYIAGIPRLGIPALRMADGPPGVLTRQPSSALTATMGVAATFDVGLARQNGVMIGQEARALGIDVALQPFINIDRDLGFKRAYNTFGEDPLLTGAIGAAEIAGIQSQHVMAMAKHFIGYDTAATDVWIDDQALHEIYLPPFEAAIHAGVAAIMCSYNHINGAYACGNAATLTGILRHELGFTGFVTSDWGATHSALFMNAGLDVEMIDGPDSHGQQTPAYLGAAAASVPPPPDPDGESYGDLYGGQLPEDKQPAPDDAPDFGATVAPVTIAQALADGSVSEATVTRAAGHVLLAMDRIGLLSGGSNHAIPPRPADADAALIEQTAIAAAVLLKNDGAALPLKPADLASLALIGPNAGQVDAIGIGGERSLGLTQRQVSPLAALKALARDAHIGFAVADDMTGTPIPAGLFAHAGRPGLERITGDARQRLFRKSHEGDFVPPTAADPRPNHPFKVLCGRLGRGCGAVGGAFETASQIDAQVNFTVAGGNPLAADTTATWTGTITVAQAGTYWLYLQALGTNARLDIDGQRVGITAAYQGDVHGDVLQAGQDNMLPTGDGLDNVRRAVTLGAGVHTIRLRISPDTSHAPVQIRLNWYTSEQRQRDYDAAIAAARGAKTAVVFAWARRAPAFALTGDQDRLIEQVAAVNPNTIVVLNTSQPVALPWLGKVKAVVQMWWPGDEGGWATAKVLLGRANPAGRLPVTWARAMQDYAAADPRFPERSIAGVAHKTTFSEGVEVGYRWFDRQGVAPLFPFGFGLSYTTFAYSGLTVAHAGDGGLDLSLRIANTGPVAGDEVPQAYLGAPADQPVGARFAVQKLVAFDRVHIGAGQAMTVRLHVPLRQLQYWSSASHAWITPAGKRTIGVGASSRDIRLQQDCAG